MPTEGETPKRDEDQDKALRERAKEDPGAGFTREAMERSRNTEFAQPPRPNGTQTPPKRK